MRCILMGINEYLCILVDVDLFMHANKLIPEYFDGVFSRSAFFGWLGGWCRSALYGLKPQQGFIPVV